MDAATLSLSPPTERDRKRWIGNVKESSGGHEGRLSRDPLLVFSAGGRRQQASISMSGLKDVNIDARTAHDGLTQKKKDWKRISAESSVVSSRRGS